MKSSSSTWERVTRVLYIAITASLLTGLFSSHATSATPEATTPPGTPNATKPKAAPPPSATEQLSPEELKRREDWRESMSQVPLPKKGCFESSYPSTEWQEVPCTTAPPYPQVPARGPRAQIVGNRTDWTAIRAGTGTISSAIGSFDSVTGVTSESGQIANTGPAVANAYSLQLNTNMFTSTAAPVLRTRRAKAGSSSCSQTMALRAPYSFSIG